MQWPVKLLYIKSKKTVANKIVIHQKQQDAMAIKIVTHPKRHLNGRVVAA